MESPGGFDGLARGFLVHPLEPLIGPAEATLSCTRGLRMASSSLLSSWVMLEVTHLAPENYFVLSRQRMPLLRSAASLHGAIEL